MDPFSHSLFSLFSYEILPECILGSGGFGLNQKVAMKVLFYFWLSTTGTTFTLIALRQPVQQGGDACLYLIWIYQHLLSRNALVLSHFKHKTQLMQLLNNV